jgi:hypothetical protein
MSALQAFNAARNRAGKAKIKMLSLQRQCEMATRAPEDFTAYKAACGEWREANDALPALGVAAAREVSR